jgi:glycerol-3-phosphate O-acyltransferase / dihydroxyacetone phosphate acyltransferase
VAIKKNDDAYRRVNHLLERNGKVMVFAEGLCVQERRLRPLKKGVARMVFGAYDHLDHDRLKVVPVGVNYSKPDKFRSKLLYNVGEPIMVRDFVPQYRENPARAMNRFLEVLEERMMQLVVHIPRQDLDDVVHYAEKLHRREEIVSAGDDPGMLLSEFNASKRLISRITAFEQKDPTTLNRFREEGAAYFRDLAKAQIKDWLLRPEQQKNNSLPMLLFRWACFLVMSPVYVAGLLFNLPPLALTRWLTSRIVKVVEFYSSFFFGLAMLIFPLVYLLWFFIVYSLVENLFGALGILLLGALCGLAALYIHPFLLRTVGLQRFLSDAPEMARLKEKRRFLVSIINKF